MRVTAVILAAGEGVRFEGADSPKACADLHGKPAFVHAVLQYADLAEVSEVVLAVHPADEHRFAAALEAEGLGSVRYVHGGATRQETVSNAVATLDDGGFVVLQNGIAPATPAELVGRCIDVARDKGAVTAFVPADHTVVVRDGDMLRDTLERRELGYTCDPQVYAVELLREALAAAERDSLTDRSTVELVTRIGHRVHLVESPPENVKLTTRHDVALLLEEPGPS